MLSCSATKANRKYFPEIDLPALLADVLLAIKEHMWFMHDGAPARELLDSKQATQYDRLVEDDLLRGPHSRLISVQPMFVCSGNLNFGKQKRTVTRTGDSSGSMLLWTEEFYLLRYNAVQSVESQQTLRRNISPTFSGLKNKAVKKPE
jgi:hypothetical protein